jgi:3-oxoadipate enol-lactonase
MATITINQTEIYYEIHGDGEETIVFSHGLLWSGKMFQSQLDFFKARYRCVAYDHRGQGRSTDSARAFDMEDLYNDGKAFIEALNLGPCHFVGLSMGGFIGMRMAARNPELIKSLILLDTSADAEPFKFKYSVLNTIVKFFGVPSVSTKVMPIMFGQKFLNDPSRTSELAYWKGQLDSNRKSITQSVSAVIHRKAVATEIPSIKCNVLVVVGDQDVATIPEKSIRIHNLIPKSTLKIIEGAGHSSSIEEPQKVNQAIDEFLKLQKS